MMQLFRQWRISTTPAPWEIIRTVEKTSADQWSERLQVVLAWLTDQAAVTFVILGARNLEQLADNLAAADLELTPEESERLTQASQPRVGVHPYGPMAQEARSRKIEGGR